MPTRERIPALDGLRTLAIGAVIVSHGFILGNSPSKYARAITYAAEHLGALGVGLFFAISGYLITTLLLSELESTGRISLSAFYTRRAFRILPAAYVYLSALVVIGKPLRSGELASAAFFFSNYWPERSWFTQHFWSLSMEEHFYLLWPLVLSQLGAKRAAKAAITVIWITAGWRSWSLSHIHLSVPALQRTDMRLDAFLCASVLAIVLRSWRRERLLSVLRSTSFRIVATLAIAATSIWSVIGSAASISTLTQSVLLPALMISVVHWEGSFLYRILESAAARWVGRISYGLYLWQQFFLVGHVAPTLWVALHEFVPAVPGTIGIAALSYYGMERPLLQLGHRLSAKITGQSRPKAASTPGRFAQVSWRNEPDAPNSEGSPGVRPKARRQAG